MAAQSIASGAQAATLGVEHTLATITSAGVFALVVDLGTLADGETCTIRLKTRARSGDTTRLFDEAEFRNAQARPIKISYPVPSMHEVIATLRQDGGTGRTFPWNLIGL